jgi:CO/xanthine dehydrogenase FAD-binding subunit
MKPAKFAFVRPDSLQEAVAVLAAAPEDSKIIAGGQSLVPVMNFRLAAPPCLVDITRISEISGISREAGALRVGATTRTRSLEVSPAVAADIPLLAHAASWVGHVQIRNRGTVGGSVAHADPAAELAAIATLLDAEMTLVSARGSRQVSAADFFEGMMTSAVEPDEILTEVRFPVPVDGATWGFSEYAQRHGDFALAGAACVVAPSQTRIVTFGPTDKAVRCTRAELLLAGATLDDETITAAAATAHQEISERAEVWSDEAAHRVRLIRPMVERALRQAAKLEGAAA